MEAVYLMGFDVWSEGRAGEEYLSGCRDSKKYRSGCWYVLCDGAILRSALLVHILPPWGERVVRGIGSVATAPEFRRQGFGRAIMARVVDDLTAREQARVLLLYADIGTRFYERIGFRALPAEYQTAPGSTLMARMRPAYDVAVIARYRGAIPGYF